MPMLKFGRNNIAVVELDRRNLNAIETNKRVFKKRYLFGDYHRDQVCCRGFSSKEQGRIARIQ